MADRPCKVSFGIDIRVSLLKCLPSLIGMYTMLLKWLGLGVMMMPGGRFCFFAFVSLVLAERNVNDETY